MTKGNRVKVFATLNGIKAESKGVIDFDNENDTVIVTLDSGKKIFAHKKQCRILKRKSELEKIGFPKINLDTAKNGHTAVSHPKHYNQGKYEVISVIEDWKLNFHRGNAVKYLARAGHKDKKREVEDLQKAKWYIEREIQRLDRVDN